MTKSTRPLRVAFLHPDLGIGGAERLVVDAALGLQQLGHSVDIYTSYHDPGHCFEETRDGTLKVHYIKPPFPRSLRGKFHILLAHLRQLHLTAHLLRSDSSSKYDVYFVDQLSTCVPFLRLFGHTRVVFYCHFPDKLLANGAFVEGMLVKKNVGLLKRIYRIPMDWLEEATTSQADVILANSLFTASVFKSYFPSIKDSPAVVYPGINLGAYELQGNSSDLDIAVTSTRPTLLSLNRFEGKKNIMLALQAFSLLITKPEDSTKLRLVLAGGYDPRLEDNVKTLSDLISFTKSLSLTYNIISPKPLPPSASQLLSGTPNTDPQVLFLLNFTTAQRSTLLLSSTTLVLLYTPANEHFGIVPVEAMACGLPVLACNSGGPTESILSSPPHPESERTGWLKEPDPEIWADALAEIVSLSTPKNNLQSKEREAIGIRAKTRAKEMFGMEAMAKGLEAALKEAVGMGKVYLSEMEGYEYFPTVFMMIVGFLIAYFSSPFLVATTPSRS